jgi:hypothetical protein
MNTITESSESHDKVLILAASHDDFVQLLQKHLLAMNAEIHISQEEDDYEDYTVCFFINPSDILPSDVPKTEGHKYIFIFFDDLTQAQTYSSYAKDMHYENLKVIFIESSPQYFEKDIDSLLWFSFSRTKDVFLHIYHPPAYTIEQKPKKTKKKVSFSLSFLGKPKYLIPIGFLFILLTHLLFIPPLFEGTVFCAAHLMFWTLLFRSWLFPGVKPKNPDPRTTDDKFLMLIETTETDKVSQLLKSSGATEIKIV